MKIRLQSDIAIPSFLFYKIFDISSIIAVLFGLALSMSSCGTIAGNPKKPGNPPPQQNIDTDQNSDNPLSEEERKWREKIAPLKIPVIQFDLLDLPSSQFGLNQGTSNELDESLSMLLKDSEKDLSANSSKESSLDQDKSGESGDSKDKGDPLDKEFNDDESLFKNWGKRTEKIIEIMNKMTALVNESLDQSPAKSKETDVIDSLLEAPQKRILIRKKDLNRQLTAKITQNTENGEIINEALICIGGEKAAHITWNQDQSRIVFTRDLSQKSSEADDELSWISQLEIITSKKPLTQLAPSTPLSSIRLNQTGAEVQQVHDTKLILKSAGTIRPKDASKKGSDGTEDEEDRIEGGGFVEFTMTTKRSDGTTEVSSVSDYFRESIQDKKIFDGDIYLVGRFKPEPLASKEARTKSQREFVGYRKGLSKGLCKNGFDEESPTLWNPGLKDPRFCLGKPADQNRFKTIASYNTTLSSLKPIGIVSKKNLSVPQWKPGLQCGP